MAAAAAVSSQRSSNFASTVETGNPPESPPRTILEEWQRLRNVAADEFPRRYLENEEDRPKVRHDEWCEEAANIPIIDFSRIDKDRAGVTKQLTEAAIDWGFFQIVNHGLSLEFLQELERQSFKFFELPTERKQTSSAYTGNPTTQKASSLKWAESLFLLTADSLNKVTGEVWPDGNTEFRDVTTKHFEVVEKLNRQMLEMFGEGLGLGTDFFARHLNSQGSTAIRWNFYPACPLPSDVLGARTHTDPNSVTILYQSGVGGLQIQKDGQWLAVKPMDGALVVNVGDALHAWTNGRFKSILHRAVVNKSAHRLSIAAFLNVDTTLVFSAPEQLVDENHPRLYRPFSLKDFSTHIMKIREEDPNQSRNGLFHLDGFKLQK